MILNSVWVYYIKYFNRTIDRPIVIIFLFYNDFITIGIIICCFVLTFCFRMCFEYYLMRLMIG